MEPPGCRPSLPEARTSAPRRLSLPAGADPPAAALAPPLPPGCSAHPPRAKVATATPRALRPAAPTSQPTPSESPRSPRLQPRRRAGQSFGGSGGRGGGESGGGSGGGGRCSLTLSRQAGGATEARP